MKQKFNCYLKKNMSIFVFISPVHFPMVAESGDLVAISMWTVGKEQKSKTIYQNNCK